MFGSHESLSRHVEVEHSLAGRQHFIGSAVHSHAVTPFAKIGYAVGASLPAIGQREVLERNAFGKQHIKLNGCITHFAINTELDRHARHAPYPCSERLRTHSCRRVRQELHALSIGRLLHDKSNDMHGIVHRDFLVLISICLIEIKGFVFNSEDIVHHAHHVGNTNRTVEIHIAVLDGRLLREVVNLEIIINIISVLLQPRFAIRNKRIVLAAIAPFRGIMHKRRISEGIIVVHIFQKLIKVVFKELCPKGIRGTFHLIAVIE